MKALSCETENLMFRALLAMVMIALAAALRIAPHPWNFTPLGAMALFSGAMLRDRRLAFAFPLLALFAGDCFIAESQNGRLDRRGHAHRRHSVFCGHKLCRMGVRPFLFADFRGPGSLLRCRLAILLEYTRWRRSLLGNALRWIRPRRATFSAIPGTCPAAGVML